MKLENNSFRDVVIAWRKDGLCERLITIIIGYHTAKALDLGFGFVWPDDGAMQEMFAIDTKSDHAVANDPDHLFSKALIGEHFLLERDVIDPEMTFNYYDKQYKRLVVDRFEKIVEPMLSRGPCWIAANRNYSDLAATYSQEVYRKFFFAEMFSEEVQSELAIVERYVLPSKRVAIHLRGGDMIYGKTRLVANFGRLKSLSVPLADVLCQRFLDKG